VVIVITVYGDSSAGTTVDGGGSGPPTVTQGPTGVIETTGGYLGERAARLERRDTTTDYKSVLVRSAAFLTNPGQQELIRPLQSPAIWKAPPLLCMSVINELYRQYPCLFAVVSFSPLSIFSNAL
jgi:hypothetical protein